MSNDARVPTRTFAGRPVGAVGLGCMGMSWAYSAADRDDEASAAVIREALDLGVTFLDTAQRYGYGENESLVGRALRGRRDEAVLATKTGLELDRSSPYGMRFNGTPEFVRGSADESLRRLGTDVIDLYYLHRTDPDVPLAETWGAMAELVDAGKVRRLGLSEVTVAQAAEAHAIHPVAAIQSELSLWSREPLDEVLGWCESNGAAFVAYSPLGRGFLTGAYTTNDFDEADFRGGNPRFQEEALRANLRIVDVVKAVAARRNATPAQIAIAWTLAQGPHVLPIPGTKRSRYLRDNASSATLSLTKDDLTELDAVPAAVGSRY
ncbi:MAG TPA: aldo/keto reductase [Streptosporangiaceae bacterium]|jgi:aryl-alcohol dehydrogenase-like predicted oxidoreductase